MIICKTNDNNDKYIFLGFNENIFYFINNKNIDYIISFKLENNEITEYTKKPGFYIPDLIEFDEFKDFLDLDNSYLNKKESISLYSIYYGKNIYSRILNLCKKSDADFFENENQKILENLNNEFFNNKFHAVDLFDLIKNLKRW